MMRKKGLKLLYPGENEASMNLLRKEERIFGVNHTVIGGMLANKWNLSERICSALEFHHHPSFYDINEIPPKYLEDVTIISVSDHLVNRFLNEATQIPEPPRAFLDVLGLKHPIGGLLTGALKSKLAQARELLENLV